MNKQKVKVTISAFVSFFAFSSCSYHGTLREDFYQPPETVAPKIPLSVIVERCSTKEVNQIGMWGEPYSIAIKEGLINAVQKALANIFQNIQTTGQLSGYNAVDFIVTPKFDARVQPISPDKFDTTLELIFQDVHGSNEIARYSTQGQFMYTTPGSMFFPNFFTFVSLGALLPITFPMAVHIHGEHLISLIEKHISESLDEVIDDIRRDQNRLVLVSRGVGISPSTGGGVIVYYPPVLEIPPPEGEEVALAVLDLKSVGCGESIGPAVSNTIRETLLDSGYYRVMDRSSMDKILAEQDFQQSGRCDDMECIVRVGKILAVPKMVAGDVARIGNAYKISLQLVDVESARVDKIASESCTCPQEQLFLVAETAAKRLLLP